MHITTRHFSRPLFLLTYLLMATFMVLHPDPAMAQLAKVQSAAETFRDWLWVLLPVAALIIAGVLGSFLPSFDVSLLTLAQQMGAALIVGVVAAIGPARRAAKLNVLDAISTH